MRSLPALAPPFAICDAPFKVVPPRTTTAPIGWLSRFEPETPVVVLLSKKKAPREKPNVARFTPVGEKIWVSLRLSTCSRRFTFVYVKGSLVGETGSAVIDGIYRREIVAGLKTWSMRTVPKSSRMCCSGLLNASAMPLGAPEDVRIPLDSPPAREPAEAECSATALAREVLSGTSVKSLRPS